MSQRVRVPLVIFHPIWFVAKVRWIFRLLLILSAAMAAETLLATPPGIKRPPVGDDCEIAVRRGTAASITLKAYEGNGRPLAYEIVSEPEHGRLSDFRQADGNRQGFASVVYTHGDDEVSMADSFTFKAKASLGGGISRAIRVRVVITDAPPQLDAPPVVSWQTVAGESTRKVMRLANAGGGVLRGALEVEPPFFLEGSNRFALGRGQATNVTLRFSPGATGSSGQKQVLTIDGAAARMELRGEATAPFTARAEDEQVQLKEQDTRGTKVTLVNHSSQKQTVQASVEPRESARVKPILSLAAGGSEEVEIKVPPKNNGGAFELAVVFSNALHIERLDFHVPAIPARLETRTPTIDFGKKRKATLIIANTGGMEGRFILGLPPGVRSEERAEAFSVGPGETKEVGLSLDAKPEDTTLPDIVVEVSGLTPLRIPVTFDPPPKSAAPPTHPSPTPKPTATPWPWSLQGDIKAERTASGATVIVWSRHMTGFFEPRLRFVRDGQAKPYPIPSTEMQGWWSRLSSLPQEAGDWLSRLLNRPIARNGQQIVETGADEGAQLEIPTGDMNDNSLRWFLEARRGTNTNFEQVSETFMLDAASPALVTIPVENDPSPNQAPPLATPGPQTQIFGAEPVRSTRTTAALTIYLAPDPSATSYRLERRSWKFSIDQRTGKILHNEFQTDEHRSGATAVQIGPARAGNKQYTRIEAQIDGLSPGTRTYWRLVPVAGNKDLAPTAEISVGTQPPWEFPWRGTFIAGAFALLGWILYLRWKLSRPTD